MASPNFSTTLTCAGVSFLSGTCCARACSGVSITVTPPTEKARQSTELLNALLITSRLVRSMKAPQSVMRSSTQLAFQPIRATQAKDPNAAFFWFCSSLFV
jgi:hypothetical protein